MKLQFTKEVFKMNNKMVISTKWNTEGLNLDSAQISQLENAGYERAWEMAKEGYNLGELNELLELDDEEIKVRGWWSVYYE